MRVYVVGMQTDHGCELTDGHCAYLFEKNADKRVEDYHKDGLTWMKKFTLYTQDPKED